jgi:hypothetical protein
MPESIRLVSDERLRVNDTINTLGADQSRLETDQLCPVVHDDLQVGRLVARRRANASGQETREQGRRPIEDYLELPVLDSRNDQVVTSDPRARRDDMTYGGDIPSGAGWLDEDEHFETVVQTSHRSPRLNTDRDDSKYQSARQHESQSSSR